MPSELGGGGKTAATVACNTAVIISIRQMQSRPICGERPCSVMWRRWRAIRAVELLRGTDFRVVHWAEGPVRVCGSREVFLPRRTLEEQEQQQRLYGS